MDRDKRPAIVDTRIRTGDWEGDTIIGSHTGGAVIASMVERKSRYTVLAKSKNKTSFSVIQSINLHMRPIADLVHLKQWLLCLMAAFILLNLITLGSVA